MIIVKLHLEIKNQQVNRIEDFNKISISGRYIYGYKCLLSVVDQREKVKILGSLDDILKEFVSTNRLDKWHEKAEEIPPSVILNEKLGVDYYEFIEYSMVLELREYYKFQCDDYLFILENLINIGVVNLYGAFSSEISLAPLKRIVERMTHSNRSLPKFESIENCSVTERKGWGELTRMELWI